MITPSFKKLIYISILSTFLFILPQPSLAKKGGELSGGGNRTPKRRRTDKKAESQSSATASLHNFNGYDQWALLTNFEAAEGKEVCHQENDILLKSPCDSVGFNLCLTPETTFLNVENRPKSMSLEWERVEGTHDKWQMILFNKTHVYEIPPCSHDDIVVTDLDREASGELSGGGINSKGKL